MKKVLFFVYLFLVVFFISTFFIDGIYFIITKTELTDWYQVFGGAAILITGIQLICLFIFIRKIEKKSTLVALTIPYGFIYIIYQKFLSLNEHK